MAEGLTCFRVDISQKEKSMAVCAAIDFSFSGGFTAVVIASPFLRARNDSCLILHKISEFYPSQYQFKF